MPLPDDLRAFLDAYRTAFDALDGDAVAALYAEPSAILQGEVLTVWADRAAVAANMRALCDAYARRGYAGAQWDTVQLVPLGTHHAFANLRWTLRWATGADPWVFHTAYQLVRTSAGWRVALCTAWSEDRLFAQEAVPGGHEAAAAARPSPSP